MTSLRTGLQAAVAALAVGLAAPPLRADPDAMPEEKAAAQILFEQARSLVEQARFAEACPKFADSERLDPGIGTMLWLADCYENLGQTASAWASFKEAAAAAALRRDAREHVARERAARLESKLSRLTIGVAPGAAVEGFQVHRDGMLVGNAEWGLALPVDPGTHRVMATAPGRRPWSRTVQVGPGQHPDPVTVPVLAAADAAASFANRKLPGAGTAAGPEREVDPSSADWRTDRTPGDAAAPSGLPAAPRRRSADRPPDDAASSARRGSSGVEPQASSPDPSRGKAERIAGISLGGAGIAAIVVGAVFSFDAKTTYDDSNAGGYCLPNNECNAVGRSDRSRAESMALAATVAMGAGAAAAAGGALLFFAAPKPLPALAIAPRSGGGSVRVTWMW